MQISVPFSSLGSGQEKIVCTEKFNETDHSETNCVLLQFPLLPDLMKQLCWGRLSYLSYIQLVNLEINRYHCDDNQKAIITNLPISTTSRIREGFFPSNYI